MMKRMILPKSLFTAVICSVAICGCVEQPTDGRPGDTLDDPYAQLPLDTFLCPRPIGLGGTGTGPRIPPVADVSQRQSAGGEYVAFVREDVGKVFILSMANLTLRELDLTMRLPANTRSLGCSTVYWSPYDAALLLMHCLTGTDTTGDGRWDVLGQNLYVLRVDRADSATRITPSIYGPFGSSGGFVVDGWLAGSRPGLDSIAGSFPLRYPKVAVGAFIPQEEEFVEQPDRHFHSQSRDGRRELRAEFDIDADTTKYSINGVPLVLPVPTRIAFRSSWSPSGRKLAIAALPKPADDTTYVFEQVWIIDVDRLLMNGADRPAVEHIDFQKRFCTYSMWGIWPEFTSERTLAVSMHRDGDPAQVVWEVTTDGRKVRQLSR